MTECSKEHSDKGGSRNGLVLQLARRVQGGSGGIRYQDDNREVVRKITKLDLRSLGTLRAGLYTGGVHV
jgi:hypothetical protein